MSQSKCELALYLYPAQSVSNWFFLSYVPGLQSYCLYCPESTLVFFDPSDIRNQPSVLRFPDLVEKLCQMIRGTSKEQKIQFEKELNNLSLLGWHNSGLITFTHAIKNSYQNKTQLNSNQIDRKNGRTRNHSEQSAATTQTAQETQRIFEKYNLPHAQSLFECVCTCSSKEQFISKVAQHQFRITNNQTDLENKILRIVKAGKQTIMGEFQIRNTQSTVYSVIGQCSTRRLAYRCDSRHRFPISYYEQIFHKLMEFPEQNTLPQDKIKLLQYAQHMKFPVDEVAKSQFAQNICQIERSKYEDCEQNTFLVYLFIAPPGLKKTSIIDSICEKARVFGCEPMVIRKSTLTSKSSNKPVTDSSSSCFDSEILTNHLRNNKVFQRSRFSPILIDVPFSDRLPEQIEQLMRQNCPQNFHYKLFHVLPESQGMSFHNQVLDTVVHYPFSVELLIYCLLNIQASRHDEYCSDQYGIRGNGIQSLSKALHLISSAFKNFRSNRYEHTRHRVIQMSTEVHFQGGVPPHVLTALEDLLEMSYKKQYDRNQNLLCYFLEEIEGLNIQREPSAESCAEEILQKSFLRIPFFPIIRPQI